MAAWCVSIIITPCSYGDVIVFSMGHTAISSISHCSTRSRRTVLAKCGVTCAWKRVFYISMSKCLHVCPLIFLQRVEDLRSNGTKMFWCMLHAFSQPASYASGVVLRPSRMTKPLYNSTSALTLLDEHEISHGLPADFYPDKASALCAGQSSCRSRVLELPSSYHHQVMLL